jgi:dienelactone hydrolase
MFSDLVAAVARSHALFPVAVPGRATQRRIRDLLAFDPGPEKPRDIQVGCQWTRDGVDGEEISWWVGYGPRTTAWLLRPAGEKGRLPGVVALHDHGGFKFCGKEKIAEGSRPAPPYLRQWRQRCYGGRVFANDLAREGFAVLVHDVFLWGSRRLPISGMPEGDCALGRASKDRNPPEAPSRISDYNNCAIHNEHTIAKYTNVLGTSLAGVVNYEDRVAVAYLANRHDVDGHRLGCVGLSGGGMRAVWLQATCNRMHATVAVGAMCTYAALLDHNIVSHTWLMFPPEWGRYGDWPDIAACRAPSPLLVQNDVDDPLYTLAGMRAANRRIAVHYRAAGKPENYRGEFYPGPHKFDAPMQQAAFTWLRKHTIARSKAAAKKHASH